MAETIIQLDNVSVTFQQKKASVQAVKDVTIHIQKGDIYGIVGYSGAGKSTLVRVINLLQQPTSGRIQVGDDVLFDNGKEVISTKTLRQKRRKIGMIFQHFNLLYEQTVIQNVGFALKHSNLDKKALQAKALKLLDMVDLADKADAFPAQLSGGQQQRVAIARALANDPEILISDEATSALDPKNTNQILDLLQRLNTQLGLTVVLITHEMDAVKRIANRVAVMDDGVVIEEGSLLDIFTNSKEPLTKEFVGAEKGSKAIAALEDAHLAQLQPDEIALQLIYFGESVSEPLVVTLYKNFNVEANIIYSNIDVLGETVVGTNFVVLKGTDANRQKAIDFLKKANVVVKQIKAGDENHG
ncbi:MAG: methionine ABC transporter ATP-binding protein [Lactobacillus sp.]|nr:methionine ABC transporter ATP-binding protein [Lactobacillus sp.]